ncbi:hypothetical protein N1F35_09820 [Pseudomonas aeruginosa]|nr:hypothetical protein [Pseudomonas aeruginosa]MCS8683004.1 hypothetical protein [Pseudomonas aeruginosa]MCS8790646.1 hypothetical protein [Pseudomonas aeruginosa]
MNKANECTCPSGDGSLVHPCPAHPAVGQAGGDERAADEKPRATRCPDCGEHDLMPGDLCACGYETDPATGYACSECDGSGEGCVGEVCRECDGSGWFVTPDQARAALAQPSPAPELERPEVAEVAFVLRNIGAMDAEDIDGDNVDLRFEDAEGRDTGCDVSIVEYAEKAADLFEQHDRIVGALRAENAKLSEALDRWPLIRDSLKLRLADALARCAELEAKLSDPTAVHQWQFSNAWFDCSKEALLKAGKEGSPIRTLYTAPAQAQHSAGYAEARQCVNCRHIGINDAADYAACHDCRWTGPEPDEDKCPGCAGENCMAAACPECRGRYELVAEAKISTPAAQAGQMPQAWLDVQAERRRQITAEGWTPEHDDEHSHGQIARAAACYALAGSSAPNDGTAALLVSLAWPWDQQWWKPTSARRDLIKAGALILAEIERLDRAAPGKEVGHE